MIDRFAGQSSATGETLVKQQEVAYWDLIEYLGEVASLYGGDGWDNRTVPSVLMSFVRTAQLDEESSLTPVFNDETTDYSITPPSETIVTSFSAQQKHDPDIENSPSQQFDILFAIDAPASPDAFNDTTIRQLGSALMAIFPDEIATEIGNLNIEATDIGADTDTEPGDNVEHNIETLEPDVLLDICKNIIDQKGFGPSRHNHVTQYCLTDDGEMNLSVSSFYTIGNIVLILYGFSSLSSRTEVTVVHEGTLDNHAYEDFSQHDDEVPESYPYHTVDEIALTDQYIHDGMWQQFAYLELIENAFGEGVCIGGDFFQHIANIRGLVSTLPGAKSIPA